MNLPKMTTATSNTDLPQNWYFRIGKMDGDEEVFCLLNDIDMLIAQQNDVVGELLTDSFFSKELAEIRQKVLGETWGD
tara:strand:+ start:387 stop:620 length:234 start_codon:yes stop_codon:yes gene_type:complete